MKSAIFRRRCHECVLHRMVELIEASSDSLDEVMSGLGWPTRKLSTTCENSKPCFAKSTSFASRGPNGKSIGSRSESPPGGSEPLLAGYVDGGTVPRAWGPVGPRRQTSLALKLCPISIEGPLITSTSISISQVLAEKTSDLQQSSAGLAREANAAATPHRMAMALDSMPIDTAVA